MMPPELTGKRVLVVEDEMLVALMVEDMLVAASCIMIGPFARVRDALKATAIEALDFGLLDVNIAGEKVFPVAYALEELGVPFLFVTGYGKSALPKDRPHWEAFPKPFIAHQLADRIAWKIANPRRIHTHNLTSR